MSIFLRENPYRGVNAHLHSYLQNEQGVWKVFHNKHIADIAEALDRLLPPGYEVILICSLQIEPVDFDDDAELSALEIRELAGPGEGVPVTRLELLSPTNKPPGDGYLQYREKHIVTIEQGVPLVELDYLHQT